MMNRPLFLAGVVSLSLWAPIALAEDFSAGPIWNNDDAQKKCPVVAAAVNGTWNGNWTTLQVNSVSVCGIKNAQAPHIPAGSSVDVNAGPIWTNDDAQMKCPVAAAAVNGTWNGNWTTTQSGHTSVCGIKGASVQQNAQTPSRAAASCSDFGQIRSIDASTSLRVIMINRSDGYRGLMWIDYDGRAVDYAGLNMGQSIAIDTYVSHPWMITDGPGNCVEIIMPKTGVDAYEIRKPASAGAGD